MTSAKVKEPLEKIVSFIKKFKDEQKLIIAEETDCSIVGVYALGELKIFFRWFIEWDNLINGYVVSLKIESSKTLGKGLALISIPIAIFPLLSMLNGLVSILIYIFVLVLGKAFLKDTENKFFRKLEKEFICSVEKDLDINLVDKKLSGIPEVAFAVFVLCLLLRYRVYYVFCFFLIVFFMNIIPAILNAVSKTGFLNWKNDLVLISGLWSGVLWGIIIYYLVLFYFQDWVDKHTMGSFSEMIPPMRNFVFMGINVIVGTMIFILFYVGIISSKTVWEETITKKVLLAGEPSYNKSDLRELIFNRISIIVMFLLASVMNWVAFFLIVDTISFFVNGKAIIIKGLNNIYAWLINYRGNRIIVPVILILCLPFLFSVLLSMSRLFQKLFRSSFVKVKRLDDEMKSKWLELYRALNQASESNNIRVPKINVVKGNYALCYSEKNIFINRARIIISTKALEILEPNELKVIIFHEVYHIIKGIGRIELSKAISRMGMFPNYYLSLLFDLNKEEYEADNFAIKELGEEYRGYLTNALIKIDINNKVDLKMSKDKKRKLGSTEIIVFAGMRKELRNLGNFLYGQKLLGYSHPSIIKRTEKLKYS